MSKMVMKTMYRLVEVDEKGRSKTLFHGINRSRLIPLNDWIKAKKHIVNDGGTDYLSGFHVLETFEECEEYASRFTKKRTLKIIPVGVAGRLRRKKHAKAKVWLADWMYVDQEQQTYG